MNPDDVAQGGDRWATFQAEPKEIRARTRSAWYGMRKRAGNRGGYWPSYADVAVDPAWDASFRAFVEHLGACPAGHTLGRHRDRGDYRPGNVAWQSGEEQADHRAHCRWFTIGDESRSLRGWAEARDVAFGRLLWRVSQGDQPIEAALADLERLREEGKAPGYAESRRAFLAMRARRRQREREAGKGRHRPGQKTTTPGGSGTASRGLCATPGGGDGGHAS
jgi:hypothetical protein